jgi:hypothetical protein
MATEPETLKEVKSTHQSRRTTRVHHAVTRHTVHTGGIQASQDSSCPTPVGYRDRLDRIWYLFNLLHIIVYELELAAKTTDIYRLDLVDISEIHWQKPTIYYQAFLKFYWLQRKHTNPKGQFGSDDTVTWNSIINCLVIYLNVSKLKFEIFTAVKIQTLILWVVATCNVIDGCRSFGETFCLHLQSNR